MRVKVIYNGKLDVALDGKIRGAMEGVGIKWYAQGKATDGFRDICFDYNPPSEEKEESQESTHNTAMLKLLSDIKMLSGQSGFTDDQRLLNIQSYIDAAVAQNQQ